MVEDLLEFEIIMKIEGELGVIVREHQGDQQQPSI